jgi:putative salt-induced outer membrane protein YdiY
MLAAGAAQAQWTGKAELGLLYSNGNSEAKSANGKFDITHEGTKWRNNFNAAALYGENGAFVSAERYEARYQADYKITDRFSWFVGLRGEEDKFSGFAYQATVSTGATYKFIDSTTTKLDASLGAGYRQLQPQALVKTDAGEVLGAHQGREAIRPRRDAGLELRALVHREHQDHEQVPE